MHQACRFMVQRENSKTLLVNALELLFPHIGRNGLNVTNLDNSASSQSTEGLA